MMDAKIVDLEHEFTEEDFTYDLEDGEQNLEDEARNLFASWDKDQLMKEVAEEREKLKLKSENQFIEHYDGTESFEDLAKQMSSISHGEVRYKIIEPYPEAKPIKLPATILFDLVSYLEYNPMPVESSIVDGKPKKLDLVEGPILPGLLAGLLELREGERANILIHPNQAFGRLGCPPKFPPDSYLLYNVKIYKVWDQSTLEIMDYHVDDVTDVKEKLQLVEQHRQLANNYVRDNMPREALIRYKAAIYCLEDFVGARPLMMEEIRPQLINLLQNALIVYNKLGMHKAATKAAKRALSIDPSNAKVYYHLIKARISLSDYSAASKWINQAKKKCPDDSCFDNLRLELNFQSNKERKESDKMLKKMSRSFL